jgi:uncharacterized repeat protein (TIGR01451 family)
VAEKKRSITGAHWMVLIAAFSGWMFDGLEMGLFPLVARPALQDLIGVTDDAAVGAWNGYIVALFLIGAAAGGLIFGWLGDKIGRVRTMMLSILCYSLFTGACYFAQAPWHLGAFRFFAALGMGGEWSLGVALVMEIWPEKLRPLLAGIIGAAANVGFLLIATVGRFVPITPDSWRWMFLVGAVPALLTIFIRLFVPESERWKESVSQKTSKPIREIFSGELLKPTLLAIAFASVALIGTWGAVSGFLPVWVDKLAGGDATLEVTAQVGQQPPESIALLDEDVKVTDETPEAAEGEKAPNYKVRKPHDLLEEPQVGDEFSYMITVTNAGTAPGSGVAMTAQLPIDGLNAESISTNRPEEVSFDQETGQLTWTIGDLEYKNPFAKATVQIVISIGAIIGCLAGPLIGGWMGRRPAYFLLCASSLVICAFLFRGLEVYNATFVVMAGLAGAATASFYGWLPLYLPELFPTRVRATGQGLSFNFGRILAAFGAIYAGQLVTFFEGMYPGEGYARSGATITLVYALGCILIWLAPETKGKPLPE